MKPKEPFVERFGAVVRAATISTRTKSPCHDRLEAIDPTSEGADDSGLTDPRPKLQIPGKSPQSYDMTSFNASRGL